MVATGNILKIVLAVYFWCVLDCLCAIRLGFIEGSGILAKIVSTIVSPIRAWFVFAYLGLYLLIPFLNYVVRNITLILHKKILIILTLFIPIAGSLVRGGITNTVSDLGIAVYYYFFVTYLKRNPNNLVAKNYKLVLILTFSFVVLLFSLFSIFLWIPWRLINFLIGRYSIFMLLIAACLFYLFKNIKIKESKVLNCLATCTLGIYLLHDNDTFRGLIWNGICPLGDLWDNAYYPLILLVAVFCVFVLCILLDIARQLIFEKPLMKFIDFFLEKNNLILFPNFDR